MRAGWSLALLAVVGCSSFQSSRKIGTSAATGLVVHVTRVVGAAHSHPAEVTARQLGNALKSTGYFLDADIRPVVDAMAAEMKRLGPNERLWLEASSANYHLFVQDREIVVIRYHGADEYNRNRFAFTSPQSNAPASAAAPGPGQAPTAQLKVAEPPASQQMRIWSFAVGVSDYSVKEIALKYAHRDAEAIDRFFASPSGGSVPAQRRALLTNADATRSNILSKLTSFSRRSAPNDMLIIYMAMHGLPDDGGELYFLAHDTDPRALVGTGLPQRDLEYALANAKAKRVVMMLDACHAGAAGFSDYRGKRGLVLAETNRLLARLAQTKPGLAVLTASSATESSMEGKKWGGGHGVFTHFLIEGMKGQADENGDKIVSVRELYDYIYTRVSEDTEGNQHPELKGSFDNLMPLASLP